MSEIVLYDVSWECKHAAERIVAALVLEAKREQRWPDVPKVWPSSPLARFWLAAMEALKEDQCQP